MRTAFILRWGERSLVPYYSQYFRTLDSTRNTQTISPPEKKRTDGRVLVSLGHVEAVGVRIAALVGAEGINVNGHDAMIVRFSYGRPLPVLRFG